MARPGPRLPHPSHLRACDTEDRHAATAEVHEEYDPPESRLGSPVAQQRLHYAWVIVTVASMICMITSPVRFAISMLVPYLQSPPGFGWSYFAISIAFALQWLATALFSPLVGWLGDRYGVRRTMLLGAYLFVVGMVLTGSMTRLWHFYLSFGILLAIPLTIYQVPLVAGVAVWFRTHLGVAMGILQAVPGPGHGAGHSP